MGSHPFNLALRFLLEITALVAGGMWGWHQSEGWLQFILAMGIPIMLATIWGVFAVPGDPSRSGKAPVEVRGVIRLLFELVIFAFATWCFHDLGFRTTAVIFGIIVLIHYTLSYDRIRWLLSR